MKLFLFFFIYFTISSIFSVHIDNITKFKSNKKYAYPDTHIFLIILFGPFCYLFLNTLRKWRKIGYYKNRLDYLKKIHKDYVFIMSEAEDEYYNEIRKINRILALNKLNKKRWKLLNI